MEASKALVGNVAQNVNSGKFFNINNEFNVRMLETENFLSYFKLIDFCSLP